MSKTRDLNGLPHNVAASYFSTLCYYRSGYMADWINHIARKHNLAQIEIDIFNRSISPKKAKIKPLLAFLDKLESIITEKLASEGFESSFISEAKLLIEIPLDDVRKTPAIHCSSKLKDINDKIYSSKYPMTEYAYEIGFRG